MGGRLEPSSLLVIGVNRQKILHYLYVWNREKNIVRKQSRRKGKRQAEKKKKEQNSAPLCDLGTKTETTIDHHTEKIPLRKSTPIPHDCEESIACCF